VGGRGRKDIAVRGEEDFPAAADDDDEDDDVVVRLSPEGAYKADSFLFAAALSGKDKPDDGRLAC